MGNREVTYRTDSNGRIISVNREWTRFAIENGAPELQGKAVLGKQLSDSFAGDETRHVYTLIVEKVHRKNRAAVVPFRCDGPTIRRMMELTILPREKGETEYRARELREEETPYLPLLDPDRPRSGDMVLVCSWCRSVRVGEEWVEVEEAVRQLRLFEAVEMPSITHGICERCSEKVLRQSGSHHRGL